MHKYCQQVLLGHFGPKILRAKNVYSVSEKEQKSYTKEGKSKRQKESQVVWNCKIECGGSNSLQIANKPPKSRSIF